MASVGSAAAVVFFACRVCQGRLTESVGAGKFPWPLTNRDYVFYRRASQRPDGSLASISKGGSHPSKPPADEKAFVRVDTLSSMLSVRQREPSAPVEYVLVYFDDMKGSIPKRLINWFVGSAVPQLLKALRQACAAYPPERLAAVRANYNLRS
eukprot:TRINITY_DN3502_c0_g1_i2.p1 TRINITY_DN3502_c0_g1~~TRINITY_DN3502_c0_g1_i2.p1  ORF type:complete len:174 (-),score=41.98 TRINITY_DN3502_c0_g1_i2:363-821(-)